MDALARPWAIQQLVVNSPRGHRRSAGQWVTFPYEEPIGFTRHFHVWSTSQFPPDQVRRQRSLKGNRSRCLNCHARHLRQLRWPRQRDRKPTVLLVQTVLAQFERRVLPYTVLTSGVLPDGVDRTKLEVGLGLRAAPDLALDEVH